MQPWAKLSVISAALQRGAGLLAQPKGFVSLCVLRAGLAPVCRGSGGCTQRSTPSSAWGVILCVWFGSGSPASLVERAATQCVARSLLLSRVCSFFIIICWFSGIL